MKKSLFRQPINTLTDREAMGMPEPFIPTVLDNLCYLDDYFHLSNEQILEVLSSSVALINERYSAATVLGYRGDPRIETQKPAMIPIAAHDARIGLTASSVDAIVARYERYGVLKDWILKECPEHQVSLAAFSIARYCITNKEYRDFLIDTGYPALPTSWAFGVYPHDKSNHPVCTVSSEDAEAYCQWLSHKTGRRFRLPTEQEWEYAAGGPEHLEFPWGDTALPDHANTVEEQLYQTTPVGIFPKGASPFGILDMAGNVEEYTSTDYAAYPGSERISDDLLIMNKNYKVARGGSYCRFVDLARTRRRHGRYDKTIYKMGFRLAEDPVA